MRNYRLEIYHLARESRDGVSAAQTAEQLGCSSSTAVKHLGRLADEGRLERRAPQEDGSVCYVGTNPTPVGRMPERLPPALCEALRRALETHPDLAEFLLDPEVGNESPELIATRIQ